MQSRHWRGTTSAVLALSSGLAWMVGAAASEAATWLEKSIEVQLLPGGDVEEQHRLRVRMETDGDLERWAKYSIALNTNRTLESFDAVVTSSEGESRKVKRKQQDRVEYSGEGIFYDSDFYHVAEIDGLAIGSTLEIEYHLAIQPYHPTDVVYLLEDDPIEKLHVAVRGGDASWRFRIDGPAEGISVEALDGGVRITGQGLDELDPGPLTAGGSAREPVLRYSWGGSGSWNDVAAWYRNLLRDLPRSPPEVRELSARLTATAESPREKLEAHLAFLRQKVRYTAVEVGIGGYRPSEPGEVLERKWGDCKDKAVLLIDLLAASGIESYPALILLDQRRRIDVEFPSPRAFNHLIVAVPESEVEVAEGDPVSEGFLFLDPTQTQGTARWLHPGVQDQHALLVLEDGGRLVRTPTLPHHERANLAVDLQVAADGSARGRAGLQVEGQRATGFLRQIESLPAERSREDVIGVFGNLFPGAEISDVGWQEEVSEVPAARMSLALEIDQWVSGLDAGSRRISLQLSSLEMTPETRDLERSAGEPIAYPVGEVRSLWRLQLPADWCPPKASEKVTENELGSFRQSIRQDQEGRTVIERTTKVHRRWLEPVDHEALRELALAEKRASKRRIRMSCPDAG